MKTGEIIPLKGTDARFYGSYKEKSNVIVYHLYDTVSVTENATKITSEVKVVDFKDIESAKVEITKVNVVATVVLILSPFILIGLFYAFILLAYALGGGQH